MTNTITTPANESNLDTSDAGGRPENFGPYRLDELVGERQGYAVFSATHRKLRQSVQLYLVPSLRGSAFQDFRDQIAIASKLEHRSIAGIVDSGDTDGIAYVAYEDIEGVSIQSLVKREKKITPPMACAIIRQAAIGLHHIHENGLLHGGVTPENLIITKSGTVKILSLGIASYVPENPQRSDASEDVNYLAPEQIQGKLEPRSEIYSLGCVLYYMVTGQHPKSSEQRSKSNAEESLNDRELGPQLSAVIRAMLDLDPSKRIQQLTQVVGAMCNWASEENLPQLVAGHLAEAAPKRSAPRIDQKQAASANPENVEISPPKLKGTKLGPVVGFVAVALMFVYAWFVFMGRAPMPGQMATASPVHSTQSLKTRVSMPKRLPEATAETATETGTESRAEASSNSPAGLQQLKTEQGETATTEADPGAEKARFEDLMAQNKQPTQPQTLPEQLSLQGEQAVQASPSTRTLPTSVEMPATKMEDQSADTYHKRLQSQLEDEYGLTDGRWVLTPNEFALISSVVSYGQKVTQEETSNNEEFSRLVRMRVANQGKNPWSSGLYIPEVDGIEKGDRVLVVVWLRTSPGARAEEGKVGIYVESAADHQKEVYLTVKPSPEWRQFLIPFQAKLEQNLRVGFHLAFQAQDVDYGGLTLINFGKTAPFWNAIPAGPKRRHKNP